MRISVVIPVYNVADYLPGCMASVLCQDLAQTEILLVDDGSTDGKSGALCDRFARENPETVRVIHQKNLGLGGARNTGLEAARGEYVLFLDSDDTLTPDALEVLHRAVDREQPDVVAFHMRLVTPGGAELPETRHHVPLDRTLTLAQCPEMLLDSPSACMRLWRRSLFLDTGIRFPEHLLYEDLHTTPKLLLAAERIVGLDAAPYVYLQRQGSIMRGSNPEKNRQILLALDSVLGWYRERGTFDCYRRELEGLVLHHVYAAAYRVLCQDPKSPVLRVLLDYLRENAPDYRKNPYYAALTRSQRGTLWLMERGMTALPAAVFAWKDRRRARAEKGRKPE